MHLQLRDTEGLSPATARGRGRGLEQILLHSLRGNQPCPRLDLQNYETIKFCCLRHPICVTLLQQTNIIPISEIQVFLSIWLGETIFKIIEYSVSNFDLRVGAMNATHLRKEKPKLLNSEKKN